MTDSVVALHPNTRLGEGLHWDGRRQCLWFVDIHGHRIFRWAPDAADCREWSTPERVGWVLPVAGSDALLAGFQGGAALLRLDGPRLRWQRWVPLFTDSPSIRLNDAKADEFGAVWCGSLNTDDETRDDGVLYRLTSDGRVNAVDTGYRVCNGPAIRPDGRLMLHADSGRRLVYAFDLDASSGELHGKRIWRRFSDDEGYPDGMTFDAEGAVWIAHWGAGYVSRFAQDGTLLRRVVVPTTNVTNVCFGGAALDRIFVTTAQVGLTERQLAAEPLAGSLFEVDAHGVRGLPGRPCRVDSATTT